jgi:phosphoglycolate phosphatase
MKNMYSLYLFDFDYTLALSERGIMICFRHVLEKYGFPPKTDEEIKYTIGYTLIDGFKMLTGVDDSDRLEEFRREYVKKADTAMTANTVLYPQTLPTISHLRDMGGKIGIISTKYAYRIRETLDKYSCGDMFDIIIGGGDVANAKPSPEGILAAVKAMGVDKSAVLYCGDSYIDAQAAENAGVDFAAVTTGTTDASEFEKYPHVKIMADLSELY